MNKNLNELSEEMQIEAVKEDGYNIRFIDNPSEKVKLEAVKQCPSIINDLKMNNNDINSILKISPDIKLIQYLIDIDYEFTKEFMDSDEYIKAKLLMK